MKDLVPCTDIRTSSTHAQAQQRALVLGVFNGTPYLLKATDWEGLSHHAWLLLAWARMLQHVAQQFGRDLPDVAYTITSSDVPKVSVKAWCGGVSMDST